MLLLCLTASTLAQGTKPGEVKESDIVDCYYIIGYADDAPWVQLAKERFETVPLARRGKMIGVKDMGNLNARLVDLSKKSAAAKEAFTAKQDADTLDKKGNEVHTSPRIALITRGGKVVGLVQ